MEIQSCESTARRYEGVRKREKKNGRDIKYTHQSPSNAKMNYIRRVPRLQKTKCTPNNKALQPLTSTLISIITPMLIIAKQTKQKIIAIHTG